ncbi:signal peptidase I [[Clostridium] bifermentans ATCC 638]|uniref:Signal peptidase I n=1 Tax=Paraclostridium bifermentans ATCC 638 = DSM 14991 TaxID=1233171 RepID=T4VQT6_PARBF|nr:signal peptidase I [Paraclostridium bifermentans]EQK43475.1 signal peptidase I [[Clostridium] bifermentans ATCC 638] [Paraclostridium bifermentans ATCC 638 = DSM 14991]RIZ58195.1 S26 family signal peptidase [Paraclostridium bifermentans]UAG17330.1 signal peptidase I [Paraclostridium bifermentans]
MKEKVIEKTIEWAKVITLAICMGLIVTYFIVPTVVSGESMYPTLNTKDYLIINKLAYKTGNPNRGDIVVFKTDLKSRDGEKKSLVKRIIGLPNDHLVIKSGQVYINDKLIDEPYLEGTYTAGDIDIKIPSDSYFAMGDNRLVSKDSRDSDVGVVNKNEIVGEVSMRLFPFKEVGTIG